jgi:hypothetical protein
MKTLHLLALALVATCAARADFSYTMTSKSANGPGQPVKTSIKGQKMAIESASSVTIIDFDAQTVTNISKSQKNYKVQKFSEMQQDMKDAGNVSADLKETGQKKTINGYNATEMVMTIEMDNPARAGTKVQAEVHIWVSPDVPGSQELRDFYRKNRDHFPWAAMGAGGRGATQAMTEVQHKLATLNGVPVLEVVKMNLGGAAGGGLSPQQQAQMAQARARLEEMQKQGGPQAQAATQALARMGGASSGGFETTMEGGNYSTAAVPDSTFAIPAGYTQQ